MTIARSAELEDWPALVDCWSHLKNGRHAWKISGGLPVLRAYFHLMGCTPGTFIPVLVDEEEDYTILGFAVIQESIQPTISPDGKGMLQCLHGFVRALYVKAGTAPEDSRKLDELMTAWAVSRNLEFLCGNCRTDFPERFAARYGYHASHVVMKKTLKEVT